MAPQLIEQVFKTTEDGVEVRADILLPPSPSSKKLPVLVWWHGGGLLQGTRKGTAPHLSQAPEQHDLIVVSADYRLAPQARMPAILSDVADVLHWLHTDAFAKATDGRADLSRVFVSGSSAGGWLALLAGAGLGFEACGVAPPPPRPHGVVVIYPISDITDAFWTTKQHPVSYFPRVIDGPKELGEHLNPSAPVSTASALDSNRNVFYHYMIQEALLPSLLLDTTDVKPEALSVAQAVRDGTVTLPPTFFVHGDLDDKVPLRQATDVYEAVQARGGAQAEHAELLVEKGKDHLYDREPTADMSAMYAFIKRHSV